MLQLKNPSSEPVQRGLTFGEQFKSEKPCCSISSIAPLNQSSGINPRRTTSEEHDMDMDENNIPNGNDSLSPTQLTSLIDALLGIVVEFTTVLAPSGEGH